jgi:predicted transcriptional regulator
MSREEIKNLKTAIYEKVEHLNNETALQMVEEAVTAYSSPSKKDILDELTPEQIQRLEESVKKANKGETIPNEEVMQKAKKWLSK